LGNPLRRGGRRGGGHRGSRRCCRQGSWARSSAPAPCSRLSERFKRPSKPTRWPSWPLSLPAYCPGFNTDPCMWPGRSGRGTLLEAVGLGERKRSLCGPERKFRAELSEGSHRRFRHSPRTWAFIRVALEWSKPISESIYESTALAPRPSRGYTSLLELLMVECLRTYSPALALVHLYPPPLHRVEGVRCTLLHTGFRGGILSAAR
jgi:hypothetical protein